MNEILLKTDKNTINPIKILKVKIEKNQMKIR